MLRLKDKENLLLNHSGIIAVFLYDKNKFKLEIVSEGYKKFIAKQCNVNYLYWKKKSLRQLILRGVIKYLTLNDINLSFENVLRNKKEDFNLQEKLLFNQLDFTYKGQSFQNGFSVINSLFFNGDKGKYYIIHEIIPTNEKKHFEKELAQLKLEMATNTWFKKNYFDYSSKPIAIIDLYGNIVHSNKLFFEKFVIKERKRKLNFNDLVMSMENRLILYNALRGIQEGKSALTKIKINMDIPYEVTISEIRSNEKETLISISFEEYSYTSKLEKKSLENSYITEAIESILNLYNSDLDPIDVLNKGMVCINKVIDSDISQNYIPRNYGFDIISEFCADENSKQMTEMSEPFSALVNHFLLDLKIKYPKILHAESFKNNGIKSYFSKAKINSMIIIPTIKKEKLIAVSFFGFVERNNSMDLSKLNQYSSLVRILMHEVYQGFNLEPDISI
ncbi:MAG: hypothetical protein EA341_02795 [Mongoliibacter sp.]|uniref:hypothetical protein n=1 Tax=Mongoliibacter sp. TaxID=2022438 RepID=UPI0012EF6362|nr:hypothetical protein [Mongoliibacter sp.]TVP52671.1 MAG: hypothetical protein EA341_02795 [Mongoliibacter sp.]